MTESALLPDEDTLVAGLCERGLPLWGCLVVAPEIMALRSPLRDAFLSWWQTGDMPDVSVQDHSASSLVAAGSHPLAALLSLDALERNPAAVRAQLCRGQERFVPLGLDATAITHLGETI